MEVSMLPIVIGYLLCFACALVVILGDYFIKRAADDVLGLYSTLFVTGAVLYGISAGMWYFAMRHVTLAQAGVAYSMLTLIALCIMGAMVFDEPIRTRESLGIVFALISMGLMTRVL